MLAQRIKTGFHRIGVTLAVACLAIGAIVISVGLYDVATGTPGVEAWQILLVGAGWVPGAAFAYGAAWVIGWIIAGFAGDGKISN
jgi:hypothetical protein